VNEEKRKKRSNSGNPRKAMNGFRFASERRGGRYAHNGKNEDRHEADGKEESVDKENIKENIDNENREY
jgi:hypothetical protein